MQKHKLRKQFSFLFTFFIAFFLFVTVILSVTKFTILSSSYFLKQLDQVDYYEHTAMQVIQTMKQNAAPAGLPVDMFDNYIQGETTRTEMLQYQQAVFQNQDVSISTTELKQRLQTDIRAYATNKKITITPDMQIGIDGFIKTIEEKYVYFTQFPYLHVYVSIVNLFSKLYWIVLPVLIGLITILSFFVYRLHGGWRRRRKYYAYALIGAGLLSSALPMYMYIGQFVEKINLHPEYMYDLMVVLMRTYLFNNIVIGFVFIVVGILCAFLTIKKRDYGKKDIINVV